MTTREALDGLPHLPRDAEGPVFREPWEAHAFAMAVALNEKGVFTWTEWAEALSREIKAAEGASCGDVGAAYYTYWLSALETLVISKQATTADHLAATQSAWDRAARATPHGQPISLANDPGA